MKKRLLALIISAVMLAALIPSYAYAANSALEISSDSLSDEARNFVSKDLTLPETVGEETVSWTSSNPAVISADGKVTRPEQSPQKVTLTAKAGGSEKSFDFTVMPENYYVNYSNSFDYDEYENSVITNFLTDWQMRWGNTSYPSSKFRVDTLSDGSSNCYIWNEMWKDRPQLVMRGIKPSGRFSVSADVYMDFEEGTTGYYDYEFAFGSERAWMRFYFYPDGRIGEVRFYGGQTSGVSLGGNSTFSRFNLLRRWVNLEWEFDTELHKMWLYIDGERVTKEKGMDAEFASAPLDRVDFNIGTNVLNHCLGIDNVAVVTKYDNVDEKEIVDVYTLLAHENFSNQSEFAVTENLDFSRATIEDYDDVKITFTSGSDNVVINGNVGEITRGEVDADGIVYATVTKDGCDYSLTKTMKFNIKGTNYKVYESNSFYYPDLVGQRTQRESGGWALGSVPSKQGLLDSMYVKEGNNHSVKAFRTVADTALGVTDARSFYYAFSGASKRDATLEMKIKLGKAIDTQQIYNLDIYGLYDGVSGNRSFSQMHFYASKSSTSMRISTYDPLTGANKSKALASNFASPEEWFDFKLEIDVYNKTLDVFINGKRLNSSPITFMTDRIDADAKAAKLVYFSANPFRSIPEAELYIDDFTAYSTQGMTSDVAIYKNGQKVTDLGYLSPDDKLSADVQLYNFTENMTLSDTSVVAGIYSGEKLHDIKIVKGTPKDGLLEVNFPDLKVPDVVENAKMKIFFVDSNGKLTPVREEYLFPHKLNGEINPIEHTDEGTGRTYYTIDLNGEHAIRSYYSMPVWAKDAEKFYFYDNQYRLYEFDVETEKYKYIDSLFGQNLVMVSKLGNVFYIRNNKEIVRMYPDYTKEVVGTLPLDMNIGAAGLLQVNDDESYLSVEITENNSTEFDVTKKKRIPVLDISTGEWDLRYIYGFDTKVYAPDHMNLNPNPAYSNLVAFAHEGTGDNGEGNPERIWLLDRDTGEIKNLFKQKMSYGTVPAETVGHEDWMKSGELMMFCNSSKTTLGGITLFKKDGSDRRYVNNDYNYLHASGSTVTDRFVVSDTGYNGSATKLVLIDCYTGKSYLLATLPQNGRDPGHTHPCFSYDGTKVIFGLYAEDLKTIRFGWMDISDIINNVADGRDIVLSDSCTTTSYGDTDFFLADKTVDGKNFYSIADGNHMNVNIISFEKETVDVELTFDYVDNGTENIVIDYVKWEAPSGKNKVINYSETVERTNSGEIKTATVKLYGINAENLKMMAADLTIKGENSELLVRNVKAMEITK